MTRFLTFKLEEERLAEALPLVRMGAPGVDENRWLMHCQQMAKLGGGVLAAAAEGVLHGVASWRPDEDLRLGHVLRVEMMVALELSAAHPVRTALCQALESLCSEHEAAGIALSLPVRDREERSSSFPKTWRGTGFRRQGLYMCKPVQPSRGRIPPAGSLSARRSEASPSAK